MDKMQAFVESAYEARKAVVAEEAVKREAARLEQMERDALQLVKFKEFIGQHVPAEMLDAVDWPNGGELYYDGEVLINAPGCVPIKLSYYAPAEKNPDYRLPKGQTAWRVPTLTIESPYAFDGNVTAGEVELSFRNCFLARDLREAVGRARETYLKRIDCEAENKRLYDELVLQHMPERMRTTGELVAGTTELAYEPVETLTPEEQFAQAFHDYMRFLVGQLVLEGQE